jgi:nitrous oxide reductase accessory protein NosL
MSVYRISIVKLGDGSSSFDLDAPNGERLISGHKLPRTFSVDIQRSGGMGGGPTLRRVMAASGSRPWEDEVTDSKDGLGLQVRRPKDNHVQFMQDGKVLAEWWPSKGTTMMDGKRGPMCTTGEDVVAWLKNA